MDDFNRVGQVEREPGVLLEKNSYKGDQSEEFDRLMQSKECNVAPRDSLSQPTKDALLMSGWHVPCHCILIRTEKGICQAFHVQPNKLGSLLTFDQSKAIKELASQGAVAIVAKGKRSWFERPDIRELENFRVKVDAVIDVDTYNWWRLLYDPATDIIWIDDCSNKFLFKYQGFL